MTTTTADVTPLKEIQKFIWSQGDYAPVAAQAMPAAEALVAAAGVRAGDRVLDVAAGDGNVAVAAARAGARVTATDITPRMVELGRARSDAEGLEIEWLEADAEALPFADGAFDRVLSCFGVCFAPRPDVATAELLRVVRLGGTVALANWTPDSLIGRTISLISSFMPPLPEGVPSPVDWGDEATVCERLAPLGVRLRRASVVMEAASVQDMMDHHHAHLGPFVAAGMVLGDRFAELAERERRLIEELDGSRGRSVRIESGYLEAVVST